MPNTAKLTPYVLAILRIVTALLFLEHATMKFFNFPAPIPGLSGHLPTLIFVAGTIELITGVLMATGYFTRIAAFVASGEMAVAYFMAHAPHGFWPVLNEGEMAIMFCFVFLYLSFAGAGAWALDNVLRPTSRQVLARESV